MFRNEPLHSPRTYIECADGLIALFLSGELLCASGKRSIQRCLWKAARQEGSSFIENQFLAFWCKMLWCSLILMSAWPRGAADRDGTARQVAFVCVCLSAACQEAYSKLLEQEACSTGCASQPAEPEIKRRKVNIFTRWCFLEDGLWPIRAPVQIDQIDKRDKWLQYYISILPGMQFRPTAANIFC